MDITGKKILVTGGAGFIGSYMVKALVDKGAQVVIVDNLCTGLRERVHPGATFYEMNMADPKLVDVFQKEKPEIIYHFAFNVLVPKSVENPLLEMDSIAGSLNILKNAREFGIKKILFVSSGFLYGNTQNLPAKESEPMDLVSPYAVSKCAVENYTKYFGKTYGLPYVIYRYATVYGPGQTTGAMADYIRKISAGQQADIWGDGNKTRDYVYIEDIVDANLMALDVPNDFEDPTFNVGTGNETTLNQLYSEIAHLLGKEAKPNYFPDRPGEQLRSSLDNSKINKALGWSPKYTIKEGLKKIIESK